MILACPYCNAINATRQPPAPTPQQVGVITMTKPTPLPVRCNRCGSKYTVTVTPVEEGHLHEQRRAGKAD